MTPNTTATSPATEISPEQLNDLLHSKGIDPKSVLVLRHQPGDMRPGLKEDIALLAAKRPDIYDAYQATQVGRSARQMEKASYVASFIGKNSPGKAFFIGLYKKRGDGPCLTYDQYLAHNPACKTLEERWGRRGFKKGDSVLWFDLELMPDFYPELKGRLIVKWAGERSWSRWANKKEIWVDKILEEHENVLNAGEPPPWKELVLTWSQLQILPATWEKCLQKCRGIYFIFDKKSRRGYVGSAYGKNNILGRWREYASTGHGGNEGLRGRDPKHFRYSILQVENDMDKEELQKLERTWMKRLHTVEFGLNKVRQSRQLSESGAK